MPTAALLSVTDLQVRRSGVPVLRGIDWQTHPGEHWVLLGANGSGKTSLLSALCGYVTPTSGEMKVLGKIFGQQNLQPVRRQIALVGSALRQKVEEDETALEVAVSGLYGQINYWGRPTKADVAAVEAVAEQTGWTALLQRPWAVLSQGERQKVLIARALLANPQILILDEPCAGLDPAAREHFLGMVSSLLGKASPQIIFVTHHVEEILPGMTHALGLREGQVLFSGPKTAMLTSQNLSSLFGAELKLRQRSGRYGLEFSVGSVQFSGMQHR